MKENEPRMRTSSMYHGGAHDYKQPDLKYMSAFASINSRKVFKILVIIGL
jgi:hypothetical protein